MRCNLLLPLSPLLAVNLRQVGVTAASAARVASDGAERRNPSPAEELSIDERIHHRDEVFRAFRHAYGAYMTFAYPADELKPLSCTGRFWEQRTRGTIDDALGGYALTMVDSLDMHAVVGDGESFRAAVGRLLNDFESGVLSFDRDVMVSVFEASIRVLGGLLSAHLIATEVGSRLGPPGWYEGGLLPLALDLGRRLLPAFDTPLGIPVHRVNLRTGIPYGETRDTCSAAAGTFLMEFGTLSRLTGDQSFETAARRAVRALWQARSPLGLVGGGVNGSSGRWKSSHAGIGAGTDSFYEYLDKSARLFGDTEMREMFREAYARVEEHVVWEGWHVEVDMYRGNQAPPSNYRVTALQAFWPAMQAAAGDIDEAEATYDLLFDLWRKYEALPDFYDIYSETLYHYGRDSPLRPELAESTLALYRATGKQRYLHAGADMLNALQTRNRVACGFASVGDVSTGALDDRMDSYFIAETLKYLFLLFDSSLPSDKQKSLFCTPEDEQRGANTASAAGVPIPEKNATKFGSKPPAATMTVSVMGESSPLREPLLPSMPRSSAIGEVVDELRGSYMGAGVVEEKVHDLATPSATRCLSWADTVLSTEGHPFIVSALSRDSAASNASAADATRESVRIPQKAEERLTRGNADAEHHAFIALVEDFHKELEAVRVATHESDFTTEKVGGRTSSGSSSGVVSSITRRDASLDSSSGETRRVRVRVFDPSRHYAQGVKVIDAASAGELRRGELEIRCTVGSQRSCKLFNGGPEALTLLRLTVGDSWPSALRAVCDWARDTVFSPDVVSNAVESGGATYRLRRLSEMMPEDFA